MSRNHYKGVPKNIDARIDGQGRLRALDKKGGKPSPMMFNLGNLGSEVVTYRDDGLTVHIYVDPVNGNDNNAGLSPAAPLKTLDQVRRKFPLQMIGGSHTIVNLLNDSSSVVTITEDSLHIGGGDEAITNGYVFRGPEMILASLASGPATAALDSTPAVKVDQSGGPSGTGRRTRLDFTSASPGWTTDDLAGNFLRVTRAGSRVFDEIPIVENTADSLIVDSLSIVGVLLATDTVEIVEPAIKVQGSGDTLGIGGVQGVGVSTGNVIADDMGATFQRLSFGPFWTNGFWGLQFDRCRFEPTYNILFLGGTVNFKDTVSRGVGGVFIYCGSTVHPAGRSDDAPIENDAVTGLTVLDGPFFIGGSYATNPRHTGVYVTSRPLSVYRSPYEGIRVQGAGSMLLTDNSASINGSGNVGVGVHCRQGGYARVGPGPRTSITGTAGDLKVETGAAVSYGTGVGEFEEVAGWNGNFTRVLEGTATAPTGDTSVITTRTPA